MYLNGRLKPVLTVTHRQIFFISESLAVAFPLTTLCAKGIHTPVQKDKIQLLLIFFIEQTVRFRHLLDRDLSRFFIKNRQIEKHKITAVSGDYTVNRFDKIGINDIVAVNRQNEVTR